MWGNREDLRSISGYVGNAGRSTDSVRLRRVDLNSFDEHGRKLYNYTAL